MSAMRGIDGVTDMAGVALDVRIRAETEIDFTHGLARVETNDLEKESGNFVDRVRREGDRVESE